MSGTCPLCMGNGKGCLVCGGTGEVGGPSDDYLEELGQDLGVLPSIPDSADLELVPDISDEPLANIRKIIPIAPGSKYVITVDATISDDDLRRVGNAVKDWWEGDAKFFVVSDQIELIRVGDDVKVPELVWCGADKCPGHEPGSGEACAGQTNNTESPGPVI